MVNPFSLILIQISGPDAKRFLQSQTTCDITTLTESCFAAHCDAKGRVQASFHLFLHQDSYYLLIPNCMIDPLNKCLAKYLPFYKVTFSEVKNIPKFIKPWLKTDWELHYIESGIAMIMPETVGLFTPHHLNYPAIGAVSFTKGCYTGQEVISRMQYLGTPKKRLVRIELNTIQPLRPGHIVYSEQQPIGQLILSAKQSNHTIALACLPTSIDTQNLTIDSHPITH